MYIIDISNHISESIDVDELLETLNKISIEIYDEMDSSETLWIFATNTNQGGTFEPLPMKIGAKIQKNSKLYLRDIITIHTNIGTTNTLHQSYEEILLFVKDIEEYHFNKDAIRIDPVYEGNEWNGHRANGQSSYRDSVTKRYNPDGKDPGNVWLEEIRTETKSSVLDRTEPFSRKEAIKRCILVGSEENEVINTLGVPKEVSDIIISEGRSVKNMSRNLI